MNRYEYNVLARVVVKAETREEANRIYAEARLADFVVGEIVHLDQWWQLPGENYLEMIKSESPPAKIRMQTEVDIARTVNRLRAYLEDRPRGKGAVAKALGVSYGSMRAWLMKKWAPGPDMQRKITEYLDEKEGKADDQK